MLELLERLCSIDATSGDEGAVRDFIVSEIDGFCDWRIDNLGNIIAFKKGKKASLRKLMIDAHMDEVGLIITNITKDGFLKFSSLGMSVSTLMFRKVRINGKLSGVIGGKPVHLTSAEERKKLPKAESLYIDIGATSKEEAQKYVRIGDRAVVCGNFENINGTILSKALDDRIGCALLITLIKEESEYDFYATFTVQEEVGLRGAKTAAFAVEPQSAIVLEATTAADIADVPEDKRVCSLGQGPAVSFMDNATVYDRDYYTAALESGIKCQPKAAVAGGNNSGAVHLSREGVRTIAILVPCRYIHSASCVANRDDISNALSLCKYMISGICGGTIK